MKKNRGVLSVCFLLLLSAGCQQEYLNYGSNPTAGKYIDLRGIKMYYETYGTGKPLLMIHGNGGSGASFSENVSYFAKKYQVILLDSRAQGKSVDTKDSLSFEMMADDEAAFLTALHIDSAYVLGFSDGGINALCLAMRHPGKVIKIASTGANLWPDSTAINPSSWKSDQKRFLTTDVKSFKTTEDKNRWKLFLLDWLQPNITLESLHTIKCPSLIIGGDNDLINVQHTALIFQHIPQAYLWILPNSGHATLRQYSSLFNKQVDDFFSNPFRRE